MVVAAAVAMVVAACSSAEPMPADEYFPAVEAELMRLDQATRDLTDRYATELEADMRDLVENADTSVPGESDRVLAAIIAVASEKMQAIIDAHTGQLTVFADRVGEFVPPDLVAAGHDELIAAFAGWAATAGDTNALLGDAAEITDLGEVLVASPYADAQFRVDNACRELIDNAIAVGVELSCPGTQLNILEVAP